MSAYDKARQIQRRKRHFVRFEGDPPFDEDLPKQLNLTATVPRTIDADTIADVLQQQRAVMKRALDQLQGLNVKQMAKNVFDSLDNDELVFTDTDHRGTEFERAIAYIQTTVMQMLQQVNWRLRLHTLCSEHREYAFAIKLPRTGNSQMFSARTFAQGDRVLYTPSGEQVVITAIARHGTNTEYVVSSDGGRTMMSVEGARLRAMGESNDDFGKVTTTWLQPTSVQPDSPDTCIQHRSLPLYNMKPAEYKEHYVVNLLMRPDACGAGLPSGQDILRLLRASLFYADTVIVAIVTSNTVTMIAMYPAFVTQLATQTVVRQEQVLAVLAQNAAVCRRRYEQDGHTAVDIYRHLLAPSEQHGAPVANLSVTNHSSG